MYTSAPRQEKGVKRTRSSLTLSEDLVGYVCSFVDGRDREVARHACKIINRQTRRFMLLWIGIAQVVGAGDLPINIKPAIEGMQAAIQ